MDTSCALVVKLVCKECRDIYKLCVHKIINKKRRLFFWRQCYSFHNFTSRNWQYAVVYLQIPSLGPYWPQNFELQSWFSEEMYYECEALSSRHVVFCALMLILLWFDTLELLTKILRSGAFCLCVLDFKRMIRTESTYCPC